MTIYHNWFQHMHHSLYFGVNYYFLWGIRFAIFIYLLYFAIVDICPDSLSGGSYGHFCQIFVTDVVGREADVAVLRKLWGQ